MTSNEEIQSREEGKLEGNQSAPSTKASEVKEATLSEEDVNSIARPKKIRKVEENKKFDFVTKDIRTPHDNDVLCGRGGGTNNHVGNENFRVLVTRKKRDYLNSSKREKPLVSKSIVDEIRGMHPPGRFLQKNDSTNLWFDIGDQKAREKTSQALREGAPEIRKVLGVEGNKSKIEVRTGISNMVGPGSGTNSGSLLMGMRGSQMQWQDIHGLPIGRHGQPMAREMGVIPKMVDAGAPIDILHRDHEMRRIIPQGGSISAFLSSQHVRQQHALRLGESKSYQGLNRIDNSAGGPAMAWSPPQQGQNTSQQFHSPHHQQQYQIQIRRNHNPLTSMRSPPLNRIAPNSPSGLARSNAPTPSIQITGHNGSQRQQQTYPHVREFGSLSNVANGHSDKQHTYWQRNQTHQPATNSRSDGTLHNLSSGFPRRPNPLERQHIVQPIFDGEGNGVVQSKHNNPSLTSNLTDVPSNPSIISSTALQVERSTPDSETFVKISPLSKDIEFRLTVDDYLTRVTADGLNHETKDLQNEAKLYQDAGLFGLDPDEMMNEMKKGIGVQKLLSQKLGNSQIFNNSWATSTLNENRVISRDNSSQDTNGSGHNRYEDEGEGEGVMADEFAPIKSKDSTRSTCLKIRSTNSDTQKRVVSALKGMGVVVLVKNCA